MDSDRVGSVDATQQLDNQTLERLHRATNELNTAETIAECTQQTVSAAIDILGFDWCVIIEADESAGEFEIVATEGGTTLEVGQRPVDIGEGVVGTVYERGEPEIVQDVTDVDNAEPLDNRIESAVTIPVGDWGVFQALGTDTEVFDEHDIRLLELLVTPLATTIERIQREKALRRQNETLERQNDQIAAIHSVSTAMKVTTQKTDIYDLFIGTVEEVLDISICTLDEYVDGTLKTRAVGSAMELEDFYTETPLNQENSLAAETHQRGETIVVDDLSETEYRAASSTYSSVISVPLGDWGVFQAATEKRAAFGERDQQLIELLADAAHAAIERIERENELARRAEQLEQRNEQLDQFASRLSHEMRNPLSVLETRTSLARDTQEAVHFDHMERSIQRMNRLIDDTLALAREGTISLVVEPVELDQLATDYWESIRTPHTTLAVETDATIHADEGRLHQLLANLFRNAVEHGSTSNRPEADDAVEHTDSDTTVTVGALPDGFYVEDDGPGIPPEDRDSVLTTGTSGLAHGTGLGLAVVRRIAEAHGWSLHLTESDDGGARFEFRNVTFE